MAEPSFYENANNDITWINDLICEHFLHQCKFEIAS